MNTLDQFIATSLAVARTSQPADKLAELLAKTIKRPDWISRVLPKSDDDELLLHASSELTVYHIKLPPGILYPPHSHEMGVIIGFYEGCETNLLYEEECNGALRQTAQLDFEAPNIARLVPDVIHAVTNIGQTTSRAIHYYLGDLTSQPRRLWDPASHEVMPFDNSKYFEFATQNRS